MALKILTILGARPQFIKSCLVSRALAALDIEEKTLHTGQHWETNMSDCFFECLSLRQPDYTLQNGPCTANTAIGKIIAEMEGVLRKEKPKGVLVYGDTNSTLAGALVASRLGIPVAHVEAGLRSFKRRMPEEINRIVTDHHSTILFPPTVFATEQLVKESIPRHRIHLVGDVMHETFQLFSSQHPKELQFAGKSLTPQSYVLATVHRQENTDSPERLEKILKALRDLSNDIPVVLPLHPRTRKAIIHHCISTEGLLTLPPLNYLEMIQLEINARLIATDSGGVQKEAFYAGVPCVILREETEWVELLEENSNALCPMTETEDIYRTLLSFLDCPKKSSPSTPPPQTSKMIAEELLSLK